MDWEDSDLEVLKKMIDINDIDFNISLAQVNWLPKEIYRYLFEKYNRSFNWLYGYDMSRADFIKEQYCHLIAKIVYNPAAGINDNDIHPDVLCAMAQSTYLEIKEIAARNPKIPPDVLVPLALNNLNTRICQVALTNPALSPEILKSVYQRVRHYAKRGALLYAIINNPHCPKEILLDLAMDNDSEVSKAAKKKLMTMHEIGEMNYVFYCGPGYSGFRKSAAAGK